MMRERKGYEWKNGFWVKMDGSKHGHSLPFFCPHCKKISGTVDDKYFEEYGFCYECFTLYVDAREKPAIDIEYYRSLKK